MRAKPPDAQRAQCASVCALCLCISCPGLVLSRDPINKHAKCRHRERGKARGSRGPSPNHYTTSTPPLCRLALVALVEETNDWPASCCRQTRFVINSLPRSAASASKLLLLTRRIPCTSLLRLDSAALTRRVIAQLRFREKPWPLTGTAL